MEVVASTEAKLSCVVHGLTRQLDLVRWESFEGEITDGTDGYEIDVGTYDDDTNSQTTVLSIPASQVTADSTFTCIVLSEDYEIDAERNDVHLRVFGKSSAGIQNQVLYMICKKQNHKHWYSFNE